MEAAAPGPCGNPGRPAPSLELDDALLALRSVSRLFTQQVDRKLGAGQPSSIQAAADEVQGISSFGSGMTA
jgi:hypothetical protein